MFNRGSSSGRGVSRRDVTAVVKWYNPTKGFGFVSPTDGSPDAFLHVSVVEAAGVDSLPEGAEIVCDLSQGQKGPQVAAIHSVNTSTASPSPRSRQDDRRGGFGGGGGGFGGGRPMVEGEAIEGRVKFFNAEKGFGFVTPDDGGKDVFVHIRAVERSGLTTLEPEQRVRVHTSMGQKGPQAERIELL